MNCSEYIKSRLGDSQEGSPQRTHLTCDTLQFLADAIDDLTTAFRSVIDAEAEFHIRKDEEDES